MQNTDQKELHPASMAFRTWWVKLPMHEASAVQEKIKTDLQWSRHTWHGRIHGISQLSAAEILYLKNFHKVNFEL